LGTQETQADCWVRATAKVRGAAGWIRRGRDWEVLILASSGGGGDFMAAWLSVAIVVQNSDLQLDIR